MTEPRAIWLGFSALFDAGRIFGLSDDIVIHAKRRQGAISCAKILPFAPQHRLPIRAVRLDESHVMPGSAGSTLRSAYSVYFANFWLRLSL